MIGINYFYSVVLKIVGQADCSAFEILLMKMNITTHFRQLKGIYIHSEVSAKLLHFCTAGQVFRSLHMIQNIFALKSL
jgi:hypothetical protein